MARPPRLDLAGIPLHVIQRGNNRAPCFFGDVDRLFYLKCLAEAAAKRGCAVHAYVLMTNHVHLLVTPFVAGAAASMLQDLGRRYVGVINRAHQRTGTLWEGRFKSSLIDTERYFLTCHRYIELNPVRAGLVREPAAYRWSSHAHYAFGRRDRLIAEHDLYLGLGANDTERQLVFQSLFRISIDDDELSRIRNAANTCSALGTDTFLDRLGRTFGRSVRPPRRGRPTKQTEVTNDGPRTQGEMLF